MWNKYEVRTKNEYADTVGLCLDTMDISSYEIIDNIPLSAEDERRMHTDIPLEMDADDVYKVLYRASWGGVYL